uniref:G-protein coupled receptors family 1 profile domain-containing protein n=1 Tax=Capra hircus TaxID=9925 RepID=A0A452FNI6_CAPHI
MPISNSIVFMPSVLTPIGIPGLESVQCWIGIPFRVLYLTATIRNALLHEPKYIFPGMLGVTDIVLLTSIVPKILGIFWFHVPEIYFDSSSGILLAMALDHYVVILTLRTAILVTPSLVLIKFQFQFYYRAVISHSYCEHMAIVKLASENIMVNKIYGMFAAFNIAVFELTLITLSYMQIFITGARLKAFNTCIAHICVFLQFYSLGFFSFFAHRFGSHIPPYIHILFSSTYLLVPPFLNPLVYGAKTKQICIHRLKMFCL